MGIPKSAAALDEAGADEDDEDDVGCAMNWFTGGADGAGDIPELLLDPPAPAPPSFRHCQYPFFRCKPD